MNNLEKLTKILDTVKEIKEDRMELKFGCKLKDLTYDSIKPTFICYMGDTKWHDCAVKILWYKNIIYCDNEVKFEDRFEIIWTPIQDHYLRMYCNKKELNLVITQNWYVLMWWFELKHITTLENKSLHEQSEETLGKIVEFLENNK